MAAIDLVRGNVLPGHSVRPIFASFLVETTEMDPDSIFSGSWSKSQALQIFGVVETSPRIRTEDNGMCNPVRNQSATRSRHSGRTLNQKSYQTLFQLGQNHFAERHRPLNPEASAGSAQDAPDRRNDSAHRCRRNGDARPSARPDRSSHPAPALPARQRHCRPA